MFLFDNVVTRLGCPKILMSGQGIHFTNHTICVLTEEVQIQHKKSTPYHLQANGTVEAFNKVCNANRDDWDSNISRILWDYHTTCKGLRRQESFKLLYGKEAIMPLEYTVPSFHIASTIRMDDEGALEECLA